jgi:hypothetical protein
VAELAQQSPHAARRVADRIATMRRRNPLVDDQRMAPSLISSAGGSALKAPGR